MKYRMRVISARDATAVEVSAYGIVGTGVAKREPGDVRNYYVGIALASARAFNDLAIQLEADAVAQVVLAEQMAKERREERAAAAATKLVEKPLLPVKEIKEKYGKEAAKRAKRRRA
jgi:hypothetical protein